MNEFDLIDQFFKIMPCARKDVIVGIGDDAACLKVPEGQQLLVSTDTLVAEIHFLSSWDAYDIAYKAVMVNLSDIAAMGGEPAWLSLSLTLPEVQEVWLQRFAEGLQTALSTFNVTLVGGDTTRGPFSITMTAHGFTPENKAVRRSGATAGDKIYVSGLLGAAALAVSLLDKPLVNGKEQAILMENLLHPRPRIDFQFILRRFATAAIDISDGLSADLHHICKASKKGASLFLDHIPVHPLVKKYKGQEAVDFALSGGDDYELCFTVSPEDENGLLSMLSKLQLEAFCIGEIEAQEGLTGVCGQECKTIYPAGYTHF